MDRIPVMPRWVIPTLPSVFDTESATPIEMVAKCYGAMRVMMEDYNKLATELTEAIDKFTTGSTAEIENFKKYVEQRLICKFNELDARYAEIKTEMLQYSDEKIAEIYERYLNAELSRLVNEKIAAGEIDITLVYDPNTESLNMTTGG